MKKIGLAPDWSAAAWRLERRRPSQWSKTDKHEIIVPGGSTGAPEISAEERKSIIDKKLLLLKKITNEP